ncbi:MAG: hypothetical protein DRP64_02745 [Verrucomicrobia bacterium]|nr:MAG: hypothetical protein DRP64_02745 [Verrucomicrobiota bacterium]
MKKLPLMILGILIAAQFAVPFSMIRSRENILRNGELFRFKTRPIDPVDPFQGRYVRLGFENAYVPCSRQVKKKLQLAKSSVYALLETDAEGFAYFSSTEIEKPNKGDYLKTMYIGHRPSWNDKTKTLELEIKIDIPFDHFYMDEAKAPRAERLVRDSTRSTNCWAAVRILDGKAVIEDVFAEGQSLRDLAAGD